MGNDYQNQMKGITLGADQAGNQAAAAFSRTEAENGSGGLDTWGLMPGVSIPLDYALERQRFFRAEIQRTLTEGPKLPFMDDDKIAGSNALKTQKEMLNDYTMDINILPGANQAYGTFVPLANMAVQSVAKVDQVGKQIGLSTQQQTADFLDKKHMAALRSAVVGEAMQQQDSITNKSTAVATARKGMVVASDGLRRVLNDQVIKKLNEQIAKAKEDKEKIEAKIAKVEKWAGYAETAVGLIAGGAGALAPATEAAAAEGETSVASTTMNTTKEVLEKGEKGVKVAGKVAGAIAELYYEDQVRTLKATMEGAKSEIEGWDMANEALALEGAQTQMDQATSAYKSAVEQYEAAINDRRMHMARAGAVADRKAGGKDQYDSQAMLWIESVMESKSLVSTAKESGAAAKTKLDSVRTQVAAHRETGWSNIEDIWGNDNGNWRQEGSDSQDVKALARMSRLTDNWLSGAQQAERYLDQSTGTAEKPGEANTLAKSGYSGPI